jgi:diguanylate cyclase (GGDEF)-like protein
LPAHPHPHRYSGRLAKLAAVTARLRPYQAWTVVVALLAVAGAAELGIGRGVSMLPVYATAIAFASWRLGRAAGIATAAAVVALACLCAWRGEAPSTGGAAVLLWNISTNSAGAVMLVVLATTLRSTIEHERTLASRDGLTGALNRSAFTDRFGSEVAAARCADSGRLLACVDLDGFKAVNDDHGHGAGDRVLADFARGVAASLDPGELIARVGGDEFALLLTVAPGEDAAQRAVRLQRRLTTLLDRCEPRVTCSTGAVPLPGPGDTAMTGEALLAVADAALYEVKHAGRNGIRVAAASGRDSRQPVASADSRRRLTETS